MRPALLILALPLLGASPAPIDLTVALDNFHFDPAVVRLHHGQPYLLHLVNRSEHGHNFAAPAFFAAAGSPMRAVEVAGGASITVPLQAPSPGVYKLKCSHFTHAMRGMKGSIVVD